MKTCKLYLDHAGYCLADGRHAVRGAPAGKVPFAAMYGLLQHPEKGWILFDTGYTRRFYEATRHFPERIYALMTPVTVSAADEVVHKLQRLGIAPTDIRHIILSHFHADHVAGLLDFPNATVYCSRPAYEQVQQLPSRLAFSKGILPTLLPFDLAERIRFIEDTGREEADVFFGKRYDLFQDNSLWLIPLPGHAAGQTGLLLQAEDARYFLVADACWDERAYREDLLPHPIVRLFFDSWPAYKQTITALKAFHQRHPDTIIVPTHCALAWQRVQHKRLPPDAA